MPNRNAQRFIIITSAMGLFVSLFPWIFSYKGSIGGFVLSVRALGDAVGMVLVVVGAGIVAFPRWRAAAERIKTELDALSPADHRKIAAIFTGLYTFGCISHKLRAQHALATHAHDLGFFSNICWNTSTGNYFYSSLFEVPFLGRHVNLILWPLSWFYKLGFGAEVLLVAQAVIIGASIPILWRIAERVTGSFAWALMIATLYVCSPYIGHLVGNDFHPKAWFAPFLLAAMDAWLRDKKWQIFLYGAIMVLAEEDAPIALSGLALLLMTQPGFRKTGAALLAFSAGVFLFYTQWLIPRFIGSGADSMMFTRYNLGHSYKEWIINLFFHPRVWWDAFAYFPLKYWRLLCMVFPTAGLAFFSPLTLMPALFALAPHFLAHNEMQLSLADIYALPAQPFIFVAAALGLTRLLKKDQVRARQGFLIGFCIAVAGVGAYRTPKFFKNDWKHRLDAFHAIKKLVPEDASLVAQQNLYPHFDTRRYIQIFPMGTTMPEFDKRHFLNPAYVICDRYGNPHPYSAAELDAAITSFQTSADYETVADQHGFLLFKRKKDEPLQFREAKAVMHAL